MTIRTVSEADLQNAVIQLAGHLGWKVHHCRPGRRADGSWATMISGDAGFPDLVMVKAPRVIFAELKSLKGRPSMEQEAWAEEISSCSGRGVEYYLWDPRDWNNGDIERLLKLDPLVAAATKRLRALNLDGTQVFYDDDVLTAHSANEVAE